MTRLPIWASWRAGAVLLLATTVSRFEVIVEVRCAIFAFFGLAVAPELVNASVRGVTDPSRPHAYRTRGLKTRECADECLHLAAPGAARITQAQCRASDSPLCAPDRDIAGAGSGSRDRGRGPA